MKEQSKLKTKAKQKRNINSEECQTATHAGLQCSPSFPDMTNSFLYHSIIRLKVLGLSFPKSPVFLSGLSNFVFGKNQNLILSQSNKIFHYSWSRNSITGNMNQLLPKLTNRVKVTHNSYMMNIPRSIICNSFSCITLIQSGKLKLGCDITGFKF